MIAEHNCPRCHGVLSDEKALPGHLKCGTCGKHVPIETTAAAPDLMRYLLYTASLPERTVRSTVALASGVAREAAELLVPRGFQNSKTYEVVVRNSLRFLTEDVGKTKSAEIAQAGADDYLARKAVGNFVDLAGLSMLHLSPMWMLAIVSDVAYGTKVYAQQLAVELKAQGLIDEHSTIERVDDILEAVRTASGQAAGLFDAPPLSVEELKKSLEETRAAISSADYASIIPQAEITNYWNEMQEISRRDNVSLLNVSTAVTMHSLTKVQSMAAGAWTGMGVASILFNDVVIGHYVDSLQTMNEHGFYETVKQSYAPYVDAVWTNFSADEATLTEGVLDGSLFKRAYRTVSGWLDRKTPPADPSLPSGIEEPV